VYQQQRPQRRQKPKQHGQQHWQQAEKQTLWAGCDCSSRCSWAAHGWGLAGRAQPRAHTPPAMQHVLCQCSWCWHLQQAGAV
jgi:hypothetical protein